MKICIFGASSAQIDPGYIQKTQELGAVLARRGHSLVFGGGANGLMGAAARGFAGEGGEVIGVSPTFFDVDGVLFDACTEMIFTETMRERKGIMEDKADAFIIAPGGIGTFDEFFETLTLKQLGRHNKPIALFNIDGFYDLLDRWMEHTAEGKFMTKRTLRLYQSFAEPEPLAEYLETYRPEECMPEDFKYLGGETNE